jgi:cytochrome c553
MGIPRHVDFAHPERSPASARAIRELVRWLALVLLVAPFASHASPRTVELFNEAASLAPVRVHGGKLYRQYCTGCHGKRAFGNAVTTTPALAGQLEMYLLKELVDYAELDRDTPEMHRLMARPELGQPQAWRDLAAYLANLRPNRRPQVGNGGNLMRGARAYADFCAFCHGDSGEGIEQASTPALRGQHYSYLLLQLKSFDTDRRLNIDGPLIDHMAGLSREDMEAIADFLARMPSGHAGALTVSRGTAPTEPAPK